MTNRAAVQQADVDVEVRYLEERAVIGCVVAGCAWQDVAYLRPDDFEFPPHVAIWQAVEHIAKSGQRVDGLGICSELKARGSLPAVGGPAYIMGLDALPRPENAATYASRVRGLSSRRKIRDNFRAVALAAEDSRISQAELENRARSAASAMGGADASALIDGGTSWDETFVDIANALDGTACRSIPTGIEVFDNVVGGLPLGVLTMICANPSVGKTGLAIRLAWQAAEYAQENVLFASLEDNRKRVQLRVACRYAGIPVARVNRWRKPTDAELAAWQKTSGGLAGHPLPFEPSKYETRQMERAYAAGGAWMKRHWTLLDRSNLDGKELASIVRQAVVQRGCRLVVVDHQGEIAPDDSERHELSVRNAVQALRDVAKDLNVAVVLLAHLTQAKGTVDPYFIQPKASDIADSKGAWKMARKMIGLWRPNPDNPEDADFMDGIHGVVMKDNEGGASGCRFWMPLNKASAIVEPSGWWTDTSNTPSYTVETDDGGHHPDMDECTDGRQLHASVKARKVA